MQYAKLFKMCVGSFIIWVKSNGEVVVSNLVNISFLYQACDLALRESYLGFDLFSEKESHENKCMYKI